MTAPLLAVDDLTVTATGRDRQAITLVDRVNLRLAPGERLAIVGESGSGKTVTARALTRLDPNVRVSGSVRLRGSELMGLTERKLNGIRGREIGLVVQDPLSALNPTMTIGEQVAEPLVAHGTGRREAMERARRLLDQLGIPDVARRMGAYPHEFSGGMRQRVVIAIALISDPSILIADEPTTAVDVRVQATILALLSEICRERNLALILITHDLGVVAELAERVVVMYAGRIVEKAAVDDLLRRPLHPYSKGLVGAVPRIDGPIRRLVPVPGTPPSPLRRPAGCAFHPRCPIAVAACHTDIPRLEDHGPGRAAACQVIARGGGS
jgi:oligopeptide/dipeptide ABC transporter ATP-binding protein